jgi:general secretion pathway protein L
MKFARHLTLRLSSWIDDVSSAGLAIRAIFRPTRKFQIVEQDDLHFFVNAMRGRSPRAIGARMRFVDGQFVEDAGARVRSRLARGQIEIVLARRRFVFRSLELPRQAGGFLDAIVRAQIDRLTPWSSSQAAFGCGAPAEMPGARIAVTVAATAQSSVMPFVTALEALKPGSIIVSAGPDEADGKAPNPIIVYSRQTDRELSVRRLRRFLVAAPALAGCAAIAALAAWIFVGADLEASRLQVSRQVAERRVALLSGRGGVAEEATAKLAKMKRESVASVIVLESLSQALPDDTYLTEMHEADGKLQITGVTREAASLIRIIEQTDQFKRATFFAPTTRAPLDAGEQFHIEAQIQPYFPTNP